MSEPSPDAERDALRDRALALIDRLTDGDRDDARRDALIRDLAAWQAAHVAPYRQLVRTRRASPAAAPTIDAIPALPTDVFRFARVGAHPPSADVRVFRTSGTSTETRGAHPLRELALYDRAARAAARYALFPDVARTAALRFVVLAPHERDAPDSSLSYMMSRFIEWFGSGGATWVRRGDALDAGALTEALVEAARSDTPVALVGTSFAFVHAEDALGSRTFSLPAGSRIMQTGGFKGRSRTIEPRAMRAALAARYDVAESMTIAEYGMTELSSQMYETTLRAALYGEPGGPRRLRVPGWVRATVVDPETLAPATPGEVGILRIDDAANVDTACCIQTADLARAVEDGIEVLGRSPGATPRGCSIAADAALGGR